MMAYQQQIPSTVDSSQNTSVTSLVSGGAGGVPTYAPPLVSPAPSPLPLQQSYELIPHRIFVGGFPTTTTEAELRTFFEKYGHIREAKVIRSVDGVSKGYGFVTFDNDNEAADVRKIPAEQLEFKGRRLNLGPAMRRVTHSSRFSEFAVASPGTQILTYQQPSPPYAASYPYYQYQTASPTYGYTAGTPGYILVQNGTTMAQTPSFVYSPVTPQAPGHLPALPPHSNYGQQPQGLVDNRQMAYAHQQQLMQPPIKTSSQLTLADQSGDGVEREVEEATVGMASMKMTQGQGTPNHPTAQQSFYRDTNTPVTRRVANVPQHRPQRLYQGQNYANGGCQQQQQGNGATAMTSAYAAYGPTDTLPHYSQSAVGQAQNF